MSKGSPVLVCSFFWVIGYLNDVVWCSDWECESEDRHSFWSLSNGIDGSKLPFLSQHRRSTAVQGGNSRELVLYSHVFQWSQNVSHLIVLYFYLPFIQINTLSNQNRYKTRVQKKTHKIYTNPGFAKNGFGCLRNQQVKKLHNMPAECENCNTDPFFILFCWITPISWECTPNFSISEMLSSSNGGLPSQWLTTVYCLFEEV